MTPHILLLTHVTNGQRLLVTIQAIATIEAYREGSIVYTLDGENFTCKESFNSIISALGGLVMRPREAPQR